MGRWEEEEEEEEEEEGSNAPLSVAMARSVWAKSFGSNSSRTYGEGRRRGRCVNGLLLRC